MISVSTVTRTLQQGSIGKVSIKKSGDPIVLCLLPMLYLLQLALKLPVSVNRGSGDITPLVFRQRSGLAMCSVKLC